MGRNTIRSGATGVASVVLWLLAFASPALAGPPTHLPIPAQNINGLNHACGTAVDSEGDIYASSAGESKIKVFSSAHVELASIPNANEPCGLAVDNYGTLFVVEKATGNVVRYVPNAYPLSGSPTYGGAEPVDSSGKAKGISVDAGSSGLYTDDALYIAKGDHIDAYANEAQRIRFDDATGGSFTLTFNGQSTGSLPYNASHAEVQEALEALSTIGVGNVSVTTGNFADTDQFVTFVHMLGLANVSQIEVDESGLINGGGARSEANGGLIATIGTGDLTDSTGVAVYTFPLQYTSPKLERTFYTYVFAADATTDQVKIFSGPKPSSLKLRRTIDGPKTGEDFGFGTAGAYLAVDPGNRNGEGKCASVAEQACTAGHLLAYDDAHKTVDEFDATGEFLDQIASASFADAEPTALAIDRSGGTLDGTIYVSAGAGPAAKLLAFGPLAAPGRAPLPEPLSHTLSSSVAVTTDSFGNVYVAAGPEIHVYDPAGSELLKFQDAKLAVDLAVDSTGRVYVLDRLNGDGNQAEVTYYTPSAFPPVSGTTYVRHEPSLVKAGEAGIAPYLTALGINPANDHIFVGGHPPDGFIEFDSAAHGSAVLDPEFAKISTSIDGVIGDIAVDGRSGYAYVSYNNPPEIGIIDPASEEVVARVTGKGGLKGSVGSDPAIAVDQSNGHVLVFSASNGVAEEYDASGAFVTQFFNPQFGEFQAGGTYGIAIDNAASSPNRGNAYVAHSEPKPKTPGLWAFGPLAYGEAPIALSGAANGLGAGTATLHGTVDPRGFDLTECKFEYLTDGQYLLNGRTFAGAASNLCAESLAQIGKGTGAEAVHTVLAGLEPGARYRFHIVARNKYGESAGGDGLFGPPVLTTKSALPVLHDEATLRGEVDPSGLPTKYHFLYGTSEGYGQSTPVVVLPGGDGAVAVQASLLDLAEGTTYHFRLVAENEAKIVEGPDQTFTTGERNDAQSCTNTEFRTGLSANLPDCRAYELVTPAETRGAKLYGGTSGDAGRNINNLLTVPRGAGAGEVLSYFSDSTLPGFDGNGHLSDGYRARRALGEGPHPAQGWTTEHVGPTYTQGGGGGSAPLGTASDQLYTFWAINPFEALVGALPRGTYLHTPSGFEVAGMGEPFGDGKVVTDPDAESRYLSAGGTHVIFSSKAHLEPDAAPAGTEAIYDRAAGSSSASVVSIKPDQTAFAAGENARYVSAAEDGSAIVFSVGGALYLHRAGQTTEIAAAPNTFAGISEDGERVFFADVAYLAEPIPAGLFVCDVETGPCAGPGAHSPVEIAPESIFVNVSTDGSNAFFTSKEALTGGEGNEAGEQAEAEEHNLYAWDGASTRFVAILDPEDFVGFGGVAAIRLDSWAEAIVSGKTAGNGRANSPTRSTSTGRALVFQSHAQLTAYDNEGASEIYRYAPSAAQGERLVCVSCDPSDAPPSADAMLQSFNFGSAVSANTVIANLTDDGGSVFFQASDRLLPEDANEAQDVYEWKANGAGDCKRPSGCLALISSGQGEGDNYIYNMSADGHDVFFSTKEKLVSADVLGSPSIYDARVEGGIPDPPSAAPCQGDACQGRGSTSPVLPAPTSSGAGNGNLGREAKARCAKSRHAVRRQGKVRCVKRHTKKHQHKRRRANANGRAHR